MNGRLDISYMFFTKSITKCKQKASEVKGFNVGHFTEQVYKFVVFVCFVLFSSLI